MKKIFLVLLIILYNSVSIAQEQDEKILFKTVSVKDGKLKKFPYLSSDFVSQFSIGDSIYVFDFKNRNYLVSINNDIGYIYQGLYFFENYKIKKYSDSIRRLERDSLSVYRKRSNIYNEKRVKEYKTKCQYRTNKVDEFSGKIRKSTPYYELGKIHNFYISISLGNFNGRKYLYFTTNLDIGCTNPYKSDRSTAKIKLENGDILNFYHSGVLDCGEYYLTGKLSNSEIIKLKKSKISTIRLIGTEGYQDFTEIEYNDVFFDKLKCIE